MSEIGLLEFVRMMSAEPTEEQNDAAAVERLAPSGDELVITPAEEAD